MLRSEQREHIFKMLFQIEFNEAADMPEHIRLYCESLENAAEKDKEYIQKKYEAVVSRVPEIDALINENAKGWKTSRMNKADLTVLRLAVYEMKWDEDIPTGVAINEAVELARKFGGSGSPAESGPAESPDQRCCCPGGGTAEKRPDHGLSAACRLFPR